MEEKFTEDAYIPNVTPAELPDDLTEADDPMTLADQLNGMAEEIDAEAPAAPKKKAEKLLKKYRNAASACKAAAERVKGDLRACGRNPYITASTTSRYDFYRKKGDETPVDSVVLERTVGFSARSLAIAGALFAAVSIAVGKRLLK